MWPIIYGQTPPAHAAAATTSSSSIIIIIIIMMKIPLNIEFSGGGGLSIP
jgi:hypothetical protein